jgi:hypothetical protein
MDTQGHLCSLSNAVMRPHQRLHLRGHFPTVDQLPGPDLFCEQRWA